MNKKKRTLVVALIMILITSGCTLQGVTDENNQTDLNLQAMSFKIRTDDGNYGMDYNSDCIYLMTPSYVDGICIKDLAAGGAGDGDTNYDWTLQGITDQNGSTIDDINIASLFLGQNARIDVNTDCLYFIDDTYHKGICIDSLAAGGSDTNYAWTIQGTTDNNSSTTNDINANRFMLGQNGIIDANSDCIFLKDSQNPNGICLADLLTDNDTNYTPQLDEVVQTGDTTTSSIFTGGYYWQEAATDGMDFNSDCMYFDDPQHDDICLADLVYYEANTDTNYAWTLQGITDQNNQTIDDINAIRYNLLNNAKIDVNSDCLFFTDTTYSQGICIDSLAAGGTDTNYDWTLQGVTDQNSSTTNDINAGAYYLGQNAYMDVNSDCLFFADSTYPQGACVDDFLAGGGSGTPGGSNREVQFNNGGSFAGDENFNYNSTLDQLFLSSTRGTTLHLGIKHPSPSPSPGVTIRNYETGYNAPSNVDTNADGDKWVFWNAANYKASIGFDAFEMRFQSTANPGSTNKFRFYGGEGGSPYEILRFGTGSSNQGFLWNTNNSSSYNSTFGGSGDVISLGQSGSSKVTINSYSVGTSAPGNNNTKVTGDKWTFWNADVYKGAILFESWTFAFQAVSQSGYDGDQQTKYRFYSGTSSTPLEILSMGIGTDTNGLIWNDPGYALNYRIESNNDAEIFFVHGGHDKIGISTQTPNVLFDVDGNLEADYVIGETMLNNNMSPGDANFGTVSYDTLDAKSPAIHELSDGNIGIIDWDTQTIIKCNPNKKGDCPIDSENKMKTIYTKRTNWKNYDTNKTSCTDANHSFVSFEQFIDGNTDCIYDYTKVHQQCKGRFQVWDGESCDHNSEAECTQVQWQYWFEGACYKNPKEECIHKPENQLKDWNGTACITSPLKECEADPTKKWEINIPPTFNLDTDEPQDYGTCITDEIGTCYTQKNKDWNGTSCNPITVELVTLGGLQ